MCFNSSVLCILDSNDFHVFRCVSLIRFSSVNFIKCAKMPKCQPIRYCEWMTNSQNQFTFWAYVRFLYQSVTNMQFDSYIGHENEQKKKNDRRLLILVNCPESTEQSVKQSYALSTNNNRSVYIFLFVIVCIPLFFRFV